MLPEFAQMLQGLQQALLNSVLRIFPIVRDVVCNSQEFAIVSPYELLVSRYISILDGMDKVQIVVATAVPANSVESAVIFIQLLAREWQREW